MRLSDYIEREGLTGTEFARKAGIQQSAVSKILAGLDAYGKTWAAIEKATGGEVTAGSHFEPARRRRKAPRRRVLLQPAGR